MRKMKDKDYGADKQDWCHAYFMGFEKGEGQYFPETEQDKKIFCANKIAHDARMAI